MSNVFDDGKKRIRNAVESDRLSHAILISTDDYVCRELAEYTACLVYNITADKTDSVTDFIRIDGANFKAADADALLSAVAVTPSSGKRIVALSNAGKLSPIVQNMLLKTIEEPPPHNHFLLYGNESGLLPTIRSRCALLALGELSYDDIAEYVVGIGATAKDAMYYAYLSGGSIEIAQKLYNDEDFRDFAASCATFFCRIKRASLVNDKLKDFATVNPTYAVTVFELCLSDMRRRKLGLTAKVFIRPPLCDSITDCADILTEKQIALIAELMNETKTALCSNVPARQVLENFAAKAEQIVA